MIQTESRRREGADFVKELFVLLNREEAEYPRDGRSLKVRPRLYYGHFHGLIPVVRVPRIQQKFSLRIHFGNFFKEQRHWLPHSCCVASP